MRAQTALGGAGSAAAVALALMLAPAMAASPQQQKPRHEGGGVSLVGGTFTPAMSDPKLQAELSRRGFQLGSFRFTPSNASSEKSKSIRVAVRARAATPAEAIRSASEASSSTPVTAITPTAYNLGVAVGWRRFAISGDVARVEGGALPGGREAAEVGLSYSATPRLTGRLELGADRADGAQRIIAADSSYSIGAGASFRLTHNLDLTGGVRYKVQHDRLQTLTDERRDSQAVYIGTAFRF